MLPTLDAIVQRGFIRSNSVAARMQALPTGNGDNPPKFCTQRPKAHRPSQLSAHPLLILPTQSRSKDYAQTKHHPQKTFLCVHRRHTRIDLSIVGP